MRAIELKPLIGRLNDVCRRALEAAAGVTALRTHYNVEIEHLLIGLLDRTDTRLRRDPAQVGRRAGAPAGGPQPLARPDEDRQRARARALARYRRDGQAGLAAGLRRAGRQPRALGPSAVGVARRRDAGAPCARDLGPVRPDPAGHAQERLPRDLRQHGRGGAGDQPGGRLRSGRHRVGRSAAGRIRGPRSVHDRPDGAGQGRQDRSDPRPRRRNPPDDRHPDAPPAEQSDPHRRSGRRQDRRRRRPRAAHRRRRRAAGAARRDLAHARSRPAAGRRRREGRIREPPEVGDRRDQGQPQADHPVHRRSPHADRRRRRRRARTMRPIC